MTHNAFNFEESKVKAKLAISRGFGNWSEHTKSPGANIIAARLIRKAVIAARKAKFTKKELLNIATTHKETFNMFVLDVLKIKFNITGENKMKILNITRTRAKELATVSNTILEMLEIPCENREFLAAYGDGLDIELDGNILKNPTFNPSFLSSGGYSIAKPSQTINGIKCPMYLTKSPSAGEIYYTARLVTGAEDNFTADGIVWHNDTVDEFTFNRGMCYASEADVLEVLAAQYPIIQTFNHS